MQKLASNDQKALSIKFGGVFFVVLWEGKKQISRCR